MSQSLPLAEPDPKLRMVKLGILGVLACFIFVLGIYHEDVNTLLSFNRSDIEQGEWWRLLSCNLVHLNVNHMLMNLSVYILAVLLFQKDTEIVQWYLALIACFLTVSLGLLFIDTQVRNYVGLSGALYGIVVFGILLNVKENAWLYGIVYLFITYKVISQQLPSYNPQEMREFIEGNVIASSHLYGMATGNVCAGIYYLNKVIRRHLYIN